MDQGKYFWKHVSEDEAKNLERFLKEEDGDIVLNLEGNEFEVGVFIDRLRKRASRELEKSHLLKIHLMYGVEPTLIIPNVFVSASGIRIKLYITVFRLYLFAFQVEGDSNIYEASEDNLSRVLDTTVSLGFGVSYKDLNGNDLDNYEMGISKLWAAFAAFVRYAQFPNGGTSDVKNAFLAFILMVLEAVRSYEIDRFVTRVCQEGYYCLEAMVDISGIVLNWKKHWNYYHLLCWSYRGLTENNSCQEFLWGERNLPREIRDLALAPYPATVEIPDNFFKEISNVKESLEKKGRSRRQ